MNLFLFPIFGFIPILNNLTGILTKNLFKQNIFSILVIISLVLLGISLIMLFISKFMNQNDKILKKTDWTLIGSVLLVVILFIISNLLILFLFKYFKPPFVILVLSILGIVIAYIFNLYLYDIKATIKDILIILVIIGCILFISRNKAFYQDDSIKNQFLKKNLCL